jgi:spore coat polysaccharide biosynthesis predicted glycosyltransferase SpsG
VDPAPGTPEDAAALRAAATEAGAAVIVIDHYAIGPGYCETVAETHGLVVIDDLATAPIAAADIVVNPAARFTGADYRRIAPRGQLMLGSLFALVRRDFTSHPDRYRDLALRPGLVVSFGGADPRGLTLPFTQTLLASPLPGAELTVLIGAGHPHAQALRDLARRREGMTVHADPPSVADLFAEAGLAVSAAGGTLAELAIMGVPALAVIVADNQVPTAVAGPYPWLDARETPVAKIAAACVDLWRNLQKRRDIAAEAASRIDGDGARRVAQAIIELTRRF